MEEHAVVLAELIRAADARIAELRSLQAESPAARPDGPAARRSEGSVGAERFADSEVFAPGAVGVSGAGAAVRAVGAACWADPLTGRIVELARAGRTPVEIAAELHEHTGKVELILALSRVGDERGSGVGRSLQRG